MKSSYAIAALLTIAAVVWVASGQLGQSTNLPPSQKPSADLTKIEVEPMVRVRHALAVPHATEEILRGRTEAIRTVDIKSETYGRIVKLEVDRGSRVTEGQVIAVLDAEDRPARVSEAKALRAQRQIEYEADMKLSAKGFRAETHVAASKASLEAAQAQVRVAETALEDTIILAPFDGRIDERMVEMGDFLEMGDAIAQLVDLQLVLVVAQVNERVVGQIKVGHSASARLITGEEVKGHVRFVSTIADPATRTFRIELVVENPTESVADGITAELWIPTGESQAYYVSPAILTLSESGTIGIKTLDDQNRVVFQPVDILGSDPGGIWLSGLPDELVLITVGQEFVKEGQAVRPIDEDSLQPFKRDWGS